MQSWNFRSMVLCNEINLNTIGSHFGYDRKFKWEDALVLTEKQLTGIIRQVENKWVYIYYFGALVFINFEFHEIQDVIKYLKNIDNSLKNSIPNEYVDDYRLEVDPSYGYAIYNDMMTSDKFEKYYLDILSLILAKSISLKKIETDTDKLLDNIEDVINNLDTGKFNISDKQIAKTSAKVLRFKYNTISYLMLLEKPRSAWNNEDIESFFMEITGLFDIRDRYEKITHKTEVLQDITDVFSSLTHEKRGTRLEIMVIILILFELIISVIEFLSRTH